VAGSVDSEGPGLDLAEQTTTKPVLDPLWRKRANAYCRPVPFGFIGEVIGALLSHIEALEKR
jgi:hypothetical protein